MTPAATLRIRTWNLAGRGDARHSDLIETTDCDVLLLTEVSERVELCRGRAAAPGVLG